MNRHCRQDFELHSNDDPYYDIKQFIIIIQINYVLGIHYVLSRLHGTKNEK